MGLSYSNFEHSPTKNVSGGPIRGRVFTSHDHPDKIVDGYLGIPYAQPPVGERRFKKPQPIEPWNNTLECTSFGPRCPQTDEYFAQYLNIVGKDEANCLTLNVLAPRWTSAEWPDGLPVMVWIHGGAFAIHSSSNYGAATVARNLCVKDVVFVSINYRLGVFGFFSTGNSKCYGNMGLWDQTLALKWVQENIATFGGNPKNVTIFGQSAGGASVDLLSLSPHSRDLFQRAIAMAGSAECDFAVRTKESQATLSREFARYMGWQGEDDAEDGLLDWLQHQPTSRLEVGMGAKKGFKHSQSGSLYFVPNVDGDFFPRPLCELRKEIPHRQVMTGTTQEEGLFFLALLGFPPTVENIRRFCRSIFRACDYGSEAESVQKDVVNFYTKDVDPKDKQLMSRRFVELMGDYAINTGVFNLANKMASLGHDVYFYSFEHCNHDGFGLFRFVLPFRAATHCTEIRYILGKGVISKFRPNAEDKIMIEKMTDYFSNFAKYGNPNNTSKGGNWQKHDIERPFRHLRIGTSECEMKDDYLRRRPDFWNKTVVSRNRTRQNL